MAEIRKHEVTPTSAIDIALAAALGEPIKPTTPGAPEPPVEEPVDATSVTFALDSWLDAPPTPR